MTYEQAIKLLHPDTTKEAIEEIEYKYGFHGKTSVPHKINKACEMACKAMEKQIPKKPIFHNELYSCPICGDELIILKGDKFCGECGQALDWSDT